MHAGRVRELEGAEIFALIGQPELAAQTFELHIANDQVGLARCSVGNDRALHVGDDGLDVGFINAKDRCTVKRHAIHELDESALNVFERSILVEMLAIDSGHDGNHRCEHQEAAVTLVRFDHKVFTFAETRGGASLVDPSADHKRRVEMRCRKDGSNNGSGSRFAVRAGDGNPIFQAHQFGEHLRAGNHGDFHFMRFDDFGIVRSNGGRGDHNVRAIGVRRLMAFVDGCTQILQALRDSGRLEVRAGYGIAERQKHFGDAAHTDAADADQVNALKIAK